MTQAQLADFAGHYSLSSIQVCFRDAPAECARGSNLPGSVQFRTKDQCASERMFVRTLSITFAAVFEDFVSTLPDLKYSWMHLHGHRCSGLYCSNNVQCADRGPIEHNSAVHPPEMAWATGLQHTACPFDPNPPSLSGSRQSAWMKEVRRCGSLYMVIPRAACLDTALCFDVIIHLWIDSGPAPIAERLRHVEQYGREESGRQQPPVLLRCSWETSACMAPCRGSTGGDRGI